MLSIGKDADGTFTHDKSHVFSFKKQKDRRKTVFNLKPHLFKEAVGFLLLEGVKPLFNHPLPGGNRSVSPLELPAVTLLR